MLKLPGVKMIGRYIYSIGRSNNGNILLTIIYRQKNNYDYEINKVKVLEFMTDNRCGTIELLEEAIKNSMIDANNGKTIFSYDSDRRYIYLKTIINRREKELFFSQFTGKIYK